MAHPNAHPVIAVQGGRQFADFLDQPHKRTGGAAFSVAAAVAALDELLKRADVHIYWGCFKAAV